MNNVVNYLMAPFPSRKAELRMINDAINASESDNFFEKHFAPAGYGALAWIQSLIDLPTQAARCFSWGAISITSLGGQEDVMKFLESIGGTIHSALHLLLLPIFILAGIFLPNETWNGLDPEFYDELIVNLCLDK